jgi:putative ABC transport system substrate-binding protein
MRRRDLIMLLGGAAATASPFGARAQQDGRMRRIGILARGAESDPYFQAQLRATREGLATLGWIEGRNLWLDIRYSEDDPDRLRAHADELVALAPDVITVGSMPATRMVVQRTRAIPIVFTNVGDPVAGGLLQNLARPEGNATGITSVYQSIAGKWMELLKEASPRTTRVALIFAAEIVTDNYFAVIERAADVLGVETIRTSYRNIFELEGAIDAFAAEPDGALLMVPPPPSQRARELINRLALKHRLPTMYSQRRSVADDGFMSYGSDPIEAHRLAASYLDRILRGAKVSELPVQFPTKFDLVINLKTAKALGLTVPPTLRAFADEVVE